MRETFQEIGHVTNTAKPTDTQNGLTVSLNATSRWTVTGTSYLTGLTLEKGAVIDAGTKRLGLTVNGKAVKAKPGSYMGAIVLTAN